MRYRPTNDSEESASDDASSLVAADASCGSIIVSILLDVGIVTATLWIGASLLVLFLFAVIALALPFRVGIAGYDYLALSTFFFICGLVGYMTRLAFLGPVGLSPDTERTPLAKRYSCPMITVAFFVLVGVYVFAVGASVLTQYPTALVVIGLGYTMGLVVYSLTGAIRRCIRAPLTVPLKKHRGVRIVTPSLLLGVLLSLWIASIVHRNAVMKQAYVPSQAALVHGLWNMTNGADHAGYWSLQLHPGPGPPEQYQHQSNHALGAKVVATFVGTPVGYDPAKLACAHTRGHPGYLILLHDNGVLGFVAKVFQATNGYVANETTLEWPTLTELICFAQAEDSRFTITDVLHGALHGCFCFGMFWDDHSMQRYNRYSWDTGEGWHAVK